MIFKSYELKKNRSSILNNNFFLVYGENLGLKKDIRNFLIKEVNQKDNSVDVINFYESEILDNDENFYNFVYSGSLFSSKKIITIHNATDKLLTKISDIYEKKVEGLLLILFAEILEKKSKLRSFFEKNKKTACIACYLDNERDLGIIVQSELKKNNINLSREAINLLIEKSNSDRNNLRNEIEKIKSFALERKKIDIEEIKSLINFSGDYKSDILINECLCGNILQYKKILSELYIGSVNHVLFLRVLSSKIHRLLKIKEQEDGSNNIDALLNSTKPPVFWKEQPMVKRQLLIWRLEDLYKMISKINDTELLCKKNPQISNNIFFNFFSEICKKANNYS
jgi:DNA polymerase III subunit delta